MAARGRDVYKSQVYATSDQVIEYDSPSGDYVKQYEGIPEDGVLAQSDKNAK